MSSVRNTINFNRMSADIQAKVKESLEVNLGDMEMEAIRNAPGPGERIAVQSGGSISEARIRGDKGWTPISQAIGYKVDPGGYSGSVFVESSAGDIAAWVEFGTGQSARTYLATVPKYWRDLARKFYVNGRGTIINQPYLLPAYFKYRRIFINELKQILRNSTR